MASARGLSQDPPARHAGGLSQQPGHSTNAHPGVGNARHAFTVKVPSVLTLDGLALPSQMGLLSPHVALPWVPVLFTLSAADTDRQT